MSLPSKARNVLPGRISFIGVNATRENLITAPSARWRSSGFVSFSPAGKPTSLTMNPSMLTPSQKGILPLLPLDGSPQRLEGPHKVGRRPFMPDSTLSRRSAALLRVDLGDRCFVRRMNFTRKLQKNLFWIRRRRKKPDNRD